MEQAWVRRERAETGVRIRGVMASLSYNVRRLQTTGA